MSCHGNGMIRLMHYQTDCPKLQCVYGSLVITICCGNTLQASYISSKLSLGHLNSVILVIYSLICAVSMATVWLDIIPVDSGNI